MIQKLIAGILLLVLAACGATSEGDTETPARANASALDYVKISRSPCFGACPVYELTLFGDGRQSFYGTRFTKVSGQQNGQASAGRFLDVVSELELRGFSSFKENYTRETCKTWATDHPSVTIEVRYGDMRKTVNWYTGCRGFDDRAALERTVEALETIMAVETFVGTDAERAAMKRR
ncbi:MAG: hypothetical protein HWE25_03095 [Alphaproteobacteria bacterium]|nr:hypothetical protein [Alphaproteobacteria bacterium]